MSFYVSCQQQGIPVPVSYIQTSYIHPFNVLLPGYPQTPFLNFPGVWSFENSAHNLHTAPTQVSLSSEAVPPNQNRVAAENPQRRARKQCPVKVLESAKKNSEPNLINQFLAYMNSPSQSQKLVNRAIKRLKKENASEQKIRSIFYNIVRLLNYRRGRKYVNRSNILKLYTVESLLQQFPEIESKAQLTGIITLEELSYLFRIVSFQYIRNYSTAAVLTSKRVSLPAKPEHLRRRRKIQASLKNEALY